MLWPLALVARSFSVQATGPRHFAWQYYSGLYCACGQTLTEFQFLAVSTGSGNAAVGNFMTMSVYKIYNPLNLFKRWLYLAARHTFIRRLCTRYDGGYQWMPYNVTLNLQVLPSLSSSRTLSMCQGDSSFFGQCMAICRGSYNDTLTTSMGCDSVLTTTLTVFLTVNHLFDTICAVAT